MSVSRLSRQSVQAGFPKQQSVWDGITQASSIDALASTILTSASSSTVTFTSIPQTYTHLQLRIYTTNTASAPTMSVYFNNDTTAKYTYHNLTGYGSGIQNQGFTTSSNNLANSIALSGFYIGQYTGQIITDILDYSNTNNYKNVRTISGSDNVSGGEVTVVSGLYTVASPGISVVNVKIFNTTLAAGSQLSLYGIK